MIHFLDNVRILDGFYQGCYGTVENITEDNNVKIYEVHGIKYSRSSMKHTFIAYEKECNLEIEN